MGLAGLGSPVVSGGGDQHCSPAHNGKWADSRSGALDPDVSRRADKGKVATASPGEIGEQYLLKLRLPVLVELAGEITTRPLNWWYHYIGIDSGRKPTTSAD